MKEQIALPNLKRNGFVFIGANFKALISIEHKPRRAQSAQRKHKQKQIKRSAAVF